MSSYLELAASIVAGLGDGALLLDRNLKCVTENRAAIEILGVRARVLEAKLAAADSPFELFGNPDAAKFAAQCLEEKRMISLHEVPFALPDGTTETAIVTFIPVLHPESKHGLGLIYVFRDVEAENRLQKQYTDLLARERARAVELENVVAERTKELMIALQEVTRLARVDPLTGALNRRAFTEVAQESLLIAERYQRTLGLLICDLDHFKTVNDTYGHQAGDAVLVAAVGALTRSLRRTDKVGRFGGEEFVILLSETAPQRIFEIGDRCRQAIEALALPELIPRATGRQTASIGCALYPEHGSSLDQILSAADRALYGAKQRGRNRVEMCVPGSREVATKERRD